MPVSDEKGYELEDGNFLFVYEEGIIGEIKAPEAKEEEAPMEQTTEEVPVEASVEAPQTAKKTVETVSKETYFSDMEELKREITELKEQLKLKEEVKEVVLEETPKPITFNPENKQEVKQVKLSSNQTLSSRDRILNTIYNNK
jgi:hypothetical protein